MEQKAILLVLIMVTSGAHIQAHAIDVHEDVQVVIEKNPKLSKVQDMPPLSSESNNFVSKRVRMMAISNCVDLIGAHAGFRPPAKARCVEILFRQGENSFEEGWEKERKFVGVLFPGTPNVARVYEINPEGSYTACVTHIHREDCSGRGTFFLRLMATFDEVGELVSGAQPMLIIAYSSRNSLVFKEIPLEKERGTNAPPQSNPQSQMPRGAEQPESPKSVPADSVADTVKKMLKKLPGLDKVLK